MQVHPWSSTLRRRMGMRDKPYQSHDPVVVHLNLFYNKLGIKVPFESLGRIVRMHQEFFVDQSEIPFKFTTFPNEERRTDMIALGPIGFYSMCEHHMIPFFGSAYIGYLPHERIVGLSKLPRLVRWYSRRPQLQERMNAQIADYIQDELRPKGVIVITRAKHLCMAMRGVEDDAAVTTLSALRGVFLAQPAARNEFHQLLSIKE